MTTRSRAWRRRKTRAIVSKVNDTKDWLVRQLEHVDRKMKTTKSLKELKQHQHGKLTHAQFLRQSWALNQEMRDGF